MPLPAEIGEANAAKGNLAAHSFLNLPGGCYSHKALQFLSMWDLLKHPTSAINKCLIVLESVSASVPAQPTAERAGLAQLVNQGSL